MALSSASCRGRSSAGAVRGCTWRWAKLLGPSVLVAGGACTQGPARDGKVHIVYWEKWTGTEASAMAASVEAFNASQDRIFVEFLSVSGIDRKAILATAGGDPPDITGLWVSVVPVVASSMLWLWIFNGQYGLLNWLLRPLCELFGGAPPAWLKDPAWAKPALVLMSLWGAGNSMLIYLAGLQDVPKELYESADIDGASAWRRFWHITLPSISPVLYFNVIMGIIGALQVFTQVFVIASATSGNGNNPFEGAPARSTLFYTIYLFSTAFYDLRMGYASALAWVLFVLVGALTLLARKLAEGRVHYSA